MTQAVPAGYKQTEVGIIPEDWDAKKIGDIAIIQRGASPRPIESPIWFDRNSSVGWLRISDVSKAKKYLFETVQNLSEQGIAHSRFIAENNLVMSICATVGRPIITRKKLCIHDGFVVFNQLTINHELMYYILENLESSWSKKGQTGSQMNLNTNLINATFVALPPNLKEQTAIANALSDVDALISELEKLIAKKQAIKTATMQQLLTGRTRLPQFALREDGTPKGTKPSELGEIPEDWEVVNVGDLGQVDPENLGSTTSPDYEFNYVSLEQIEKGVLVGTARTIFRNAPSRARRVLKKGDILVSTVRPNLMSHYFVQHEVNDLICSTGFSVIRFFEEKLCPGYLYQHLFSSVINNQIEMLISGSNYPAINSGDVKPLKVQIGSVEEQTAIATILSDMDAEIQALEQRLGKTRQIKQGMMQELLTGKTRLIKPSKEVIHE